MKIILLASLLFVFSSCGRFNRIWQGVSGKPVEVCYGSVTYLQFESGATVAYLPDGKLMACK